jgi:hypothetical protein
MEDFMNSDPVGVVEGEAGTPIRLDDWVACIARDPRLRSPEPVESINPFTRQPLTIAPHPGTAYVVQERARIGMLAWSEDGADEIVVYGTSPLVLALAQEVAKQLGGRFRALHVA